MIVRAATATDADAMTGLLNRIIAIGGTTAHQSPKTAETVRHDYIMGPDTICCTVAEDEGSILGWQAVGWYQGDAHIGTFVDPDVQAKGIGGALFAMTRDACIAAEIAELHAAIRADNAPGLAYYARIGFTDIGADPGFALDTGQVVGRVFRTINLR